jgi:hypothetical protein
VFAQRLAPGLLAALVLLASLALGCGTRMVRKEVLRTDDIEVTLRSTKRGREIVPRGWSHPAVIAPVRLSHILAHVDVELGEGDERKRVPAIPAGLIYPIGDALALGLEQADPNQEVVIQALRSERRFGVFTTRFLTSLAVHVEGDRLAVQLGHVDWEVPKYGAGSGTSQQDELPEPMEGRELMRFRVVPDEAFVVAGPQAVLVDWRAERFSDPDRLRIGPGGQVKRRTVLMEEAAPPAPEPAGAALDQLAPETLRRLADLEDERRRGELTEAQYQARRREILEKDPGAK